MRNSILLFVLISSFFLGSCKKDKEEYIPAVVGYDEVGDCGYLLRISGVSYSPINLPAQYQWSTGVQAQKNIVYIHYELLDDSLHCNDSIDPVYYHYHPTYQRVNIVKIL